MCQASFLPFLALFHSSQYLPNPPSGELALLPHEFYLIHCCRLTLHGPGALAVFGHSILGVGWYSRKACTLSEMFNSRFLPKVPTFPNVHSGLGPAGYFPFWPAQPLKLFTFSPLLAFCSSSRAWMMPQSF